MTEIEILERQLATGGESFYLMLIGKFLRAYGNGAFALSRVTGYRVIRQHRKSGEILVCGFPVDFLPNVRDRIREAGGEFEQMEQHLYRFSGIDGTPDETMISELKPKEQSATKQTQTVSNAQSAVTGYVINTLLSFNLSMSTPMDAMNLIAELQTKLKLSRAEKEPEADCPDTSGVACESLSGQGSTE